MTKKLFGLLGKKISYSFSKKYFTDKFIAKELPFKYKNFDIETIEQLPKILDREIHHLKGFNVTIPYKETIFNYLDEVDAVAEKIGAVNCVKVIDQYYLKGFNTDAYGFEKTLEPLLEKHHQKALVLGTGGASKAVIYVLESLKITYLVVSRTPKDKQISYADISDEIIKNYQIIINTTPLGTHGDLENECPNIPYKHIKETHILYDLIYNPSETVFLKKGKKKDAIIKNGLEMLELQAEKSWRIWSE